MRGHGSVTWLSIVWGIVHVLYGVRGSQVISSVVDVCLLLLMLHG
jgi:hypothetical protein